MGGQALDRGHAHGGLWPMEGALATGDGSRAIIWGEEEEARPLGIGQRGALAGEYLGDPFGWRTEDRETISIVFMLLLSVPSYLIDPVLNLTTNSGCTRRCREEL